MKQELARVLSNEEIMEGGHLLWLEAPGITGSGTEPGQYLMLRCGTSYDPFLRRPMSIHRVMGERLAVVFKVLGKGTTILAACKAGDSIDMLGPLGHGFHIERGSLNLLLVAGGLGVAPLTFLADEALADGCRVTLLLGTPTASWRFPQRLLPEGASVQVVTEDGSEGTRGLVSDLAAELESDFDMVCACGPAAMYKAMVDSGISASRKVQVSLETNLACGVGACLGCTVQTRLGLKQVCSDGPVFDLADLLI